MRQRIILALVVALMTSACQKKAEGQTVAVVNDEEITAAAHTNRDVEPGDHGSRAQ